MRGDIPVFTWTAPADDFVDWPAPAAATHTRGWLAETAMPLLTALPQGHAHFIGGDFGRSGDLSVFWPLGEQQDLTLATPFVVELRNCPYRTQQQILFALADKLPRFSGLALDARGNGSALAEFARQEYGPEQVEEVMITEAWYRETMPRLKAGLEDRTLILPKNADILSDLRSLRVVKGVARVPEARGRDKTGQRHGDAAVALAMAVHAREKLGGYEAWECETAGVSEATGAAIDWHGY
jgi:phage FluMu gp28-like protein